MKDYLSFRDGNESSVLIDPEKIAAISSTYHHGTNILIEGQWVYVEEKLEDVIKKLTAMKGNRRVI